MANQIKFSQLDAILDADINADIYFPCVLESDPLNKNRKITVSQVFLGINSGSKDSPGMVFSGTPKTGFYRKLVGTTEYIGLSFSDYGLEMYGTGTSETGYQINIAPIIGGTVPPSTYDLVFSTPIGGKVRFGSTTTLQVSDNLFVIKNNTDSLVNVFLDAGLITSDGVNTLNKTFNFPVITSSSDELVTEDAIQTLTKKSIIIEDDDLILFSNNSGISSTLVRASILVNESQVERTSVYKFYLPETNDADSQSELIDDRTAGQAIKNKFIVTEGANRNYFTETPSGDVNFTIEFDSGWSTEDESRNYYIGLDDQDDFAGRTTQQDVLNKSFGNCSFGLYSVTNGIPQVQANAVNIIGIDLPSAAAYVTFPTTTQNISTNSVDPSVLVMEETTQEMSNKTLADVVLSNVLGGNQKVDFDYSNIPVDTTLTLKWPELKSGDTTATLISLDGDEDLDLLTSRIKQPTLVDTTKSYTSQLNLTELTASRVHKLPDYTGTLVSATSQDSSGNVLLGGAISSTLGNSDFTKIATLDWTYGAASATFIFPSEGGALASVDTSNQLWFKDYVNSKRVNFNLDLLAGGSTRTINIPDYDITIAGTRADTGVYTVEANARIDGYVDAKALKGGLRLRSYFYSSFT